MRYCLSIFFLIFCLNSFSQKKEFDVKKKYSVAQVLQDIDYTEKYLTKFHPDPYRYIFKDSLHAFVNSIKAKIDSPLTEMEERFYIKQIVAKIGCGHTNVDASKKYAKQILKTSRPTLPLNTFIADTNRLYVLNNLSADTNIKAGDEILAINNFSKEDIVKTIYSIYTTDGYNQTFKKQGIRWSGFKYFYSFCFGFKLKYTVKVKHDNNLIATYTLTAGSSLKDTLMLPKKDSVEYIRKTKKCKFYIADTLKKLAVIDIDGFSGRGWRKFVRRSFKDIKRKEISNLVIDLRDNGGGQIAYGMNLLSYLIDKPYAMSFDRKPSSMLLNAKYKMSFYSKITPTLFMLRFQSFPKKGRLRHYLVGFPKKRNGFRGNLFVLINGKSFSMSGVTASYLKYKANAVLIGEETGGNVRGSNAVLSGKIILPNSKARIHIPMYHIYHHVDVENNGRGIMPQHETFYSKEDVLKAKDIDLEKVKELIN